MPGYRFIPNLKVRVPHEGGGYFVRTNEMGFRSDREFIQDQQPGVNRVLIFGDSFTAGDGVSNRKRFSDLLENGNSSIETFNFGLPGTGTDQQYLAYQAFATGIEHDVLVIAVLAENIRRIISRYRYYVNDEGERLLFAKPFFVSQGGTLSVHNSPPPRKPVKEKLLSAAERENIYRGGRFKKLRTLLHKLNITDKVQKWSRHQPLPEYDSPDTPGWRLMVQILRSWIEQSPTPVIIMPFPVHQYIEETSDYSNYQSRFLELANELDCTVHNPLEDLLRYPPAQRRQFRFNKDIHLTSAGHAAIAESLLPVIDRVLKSKSLKAT